MDPTLQLILQIVAPGGLAAAAMKVILNGSKQRIVAIDERTQTTHKAVERLHERVDSVELEIAENRGYERARRELSQG